VRLKKTGLHSFLKITLNGSTIPLITKDVEATSVSMMNEEVSNQYAGIVLELENGSLVVGRLINEDEDIYSVSQNPFAPQELREIPKSEVSTTKSSDISVMLPYLIKSLNREELKDLMAYLMSAGNELHEVNKIKM
jgi:putative heme-binding domain-containing protein